LDEDSVLLQYQISSHNHRATARTNGADMIDYIIVEGLIFLIFVVAPLIAPVLFDRQSLNRGRQREKQPAAAD